MHPLAHADMVGTLLLPILCIYNGWPFLGWAKPVPVDARNFPHARRDMALVAAAGPVSNLLLALFGTFVLALLVRMPLQARWMETVQLMAVISIQINLMLAVFNLLPIPPLDGFNIAQAVLPTQVAARIRAVAHYANFVLILLLFTGGFRIIYAPVEICFQFLLRLAGN